MSDPEEPATENRARASLRALGSVFASPALRRLQLAWVGSILGGWAYLVALGVYAYDQGGAAAVGLVGLVRLIPAALAAPFTASLVDRLRASSMVSSDRRGARSCWSPPPPSPSTGRRRSTLVALTTVVGTVRRPAQSALLPALVRSPAELTAANVASSTLESVGTFLGPPSAASSSRSRAPRSCSPRTACRSCGRPGSFSGSAASSHLASRPREPTASRATACSQASRRSSGSRRSARSSASTPRRRSSPAP